MKLKFYCCTHVYFVVFVVMWLLFCSAVNFILHQSEYVYCICMYVNFRSFTLKEWMYKIREEMLLANSKTDEM